MMASKATNAPAEELFLVVPALRATGFTSMATTLLPVLAGIALSPIPRTWLDRHGHLLGARGSFHALPADEAAARLIGEITSRANEPGAKGARFRDALAAALASNPVLLRRPDVLDAAHAGLAVGPGAAAVAAAAAEAASRPICPPAQR